MASTSVHLPPALVEQLDRLAAERGTSRNRVILEACEELLAQHRGDWPAGFFDSDLGPQDLQELRSGGTEMESAILQSRRDRSVPPL
ncbi:MAG: ribbon-helix-helix protein, CopG family [Deltaproteobacteria bacterium]|nr:ribbon-helix-helix protein, CopG family [Deltaproteobacteria bacterium]